MAHRFLPLRLPHNPPPSMRASDRALIVLKLFSSCLLQCGTTPHFIVCMITSFCVASPVLSCVGGRSACRWRMTGAWVRGAILYLQIGSIRVSLKHYRCPGPATCYLPWLKLLLVHPFADMDVIPIQGLYLRQLHNSHSHHLTNSHETLTGIPSEYLPHIEPTKVDYYTIQCCGSGERCDSLRGVDAGMNPWARSLNMRPALSLILSAGAASEI